MQRVRRRPGQQHRHLHPDAEVRRRKLHQETTTKLRFPSAPQRLAELSRGDGALNNEAFLSHRHNAGLLFYFIRVGLTEERKEGKPKQLHPQIKLDLLLCRLPFASPVIDFQCNDALFPQSVVRMFSGVCE